jgi:pantoate--beta-alanine ligase
MRIIKTISGFRTERKKYANQTIGFIPTMGYLHQGHLCLIDQSIKENDITIVSIFVNPAQFGPGEDFNRYPRDLKTDTKHLKQRGVDVLFFPENKTMYRDDFSTYVEVTDLGKVLCGKSRPTHFRGVTTVVLKLFNLVQPSMAYFGQKDAQQAIIIKKMVRDLDLDLHIRVMPIVRDEDGLALSSRNRYLSASDRRSALLLSKVLEMAKKLISDGQKDCSYLIETMRNNLKADSSIVIDYIEIVSLSHLRKLEKINPKNTLVAAAIKVGTTRLIDNFILGEI